MLHIFKKIKCSLNARVFIHRNDIIFIEGEIALREICGHGINNSPSRVEINSLQFLNGVHDVG